MFFFAPALSRRGAQFHEDESVALFQDSRSSREILQGHDTCSTVHVSTCLMILGQEDDGEHLRPFHGGEKYTCGTILS